jgi:hypothetical protein
MDVAEHDLEAAYVNYVRAISIVVEVIPRHRGMREIEGSKSAQALEYWAFRKVASCFPALLTVAARLCRPRRG